MLFGSWFWSRYFSTSTAAYCFPGSDTGIVKCQGKDARLEQTETCFNSTVLDNFSVTTALCSMFVSVLWFHFLLFSFHILLAEVGLAACFFWKV